MLKVLAFAGSSREESFNKKLVRVAAAGARDAGARVTEIDLADYPMPLFNQDLEAQDGMPDPARAFKRLLIEHNTWQFRVEIANQFDAILVGLGLEEVEHPFDLLVQTAW